MKQIKVVHVGNFVPQSADGVNQVIQALCTRLRYYNVQAEVWSFDSSLKEVELNYHGDLPVYRLPCHLVRWINALHFPIKTRHFIDSNIYSIDLFHLHSVFVPENQLIPSYGKPFVLTPHGGYSPNVFLGRNRILKNAWFSIFERRLLEGATTVHAVSKGEVDDLTNLVGAKSVSYIPNGVDSSLLEVAVTVEPTGYLLYMGRLAIQQKGLDMLIRAYGIARSRSEFVFPHLILAGPDWRDGRKVLNDLARELNISDSVHFVGAVSGRDKLELISKARAFIHTSRWEGMPLSILEALALARPLMVTPETNMANYVCDYGLGWVVDGSVSSIADGLETIAMSPPTTLESISRNARELVQKDFTWSSSTRRMVELYRNVLGDVIDYSECFDISKRSESSA
jgi:glycosyltransferase involved in cell wall biosynthesis